MNKGEEVTDEEAGTATKERLRLRRTRKVNNVGRKAALRRPGVRRIGRCLDKKRNSSVRKERPINKSLSGRHRRRTKRGLQRTQNKMAADLRIWQRKTQMSTDNWWQRRTRCLRNRWEMQKNHGDTGGGTRKRCNDRRCFRWVCRNRNVESRRWRSGEICFETRINKTVRAA